MKFTDNKPVFIYVLTEIHIKFIAPSSSTNPFLVRKVLVNPKEQVFIGYYQEEWDGEHWSRMTGSGPVGVGSKPIPFKVV